MRVFILQTELEEKYLVGYSRAYASLPVHGSLSGTLAEEPCRSLPFVALFRILDTYDGALMTIKTGSLNKFDGLFMHKS